MPLRNLRAIVWYHTEHINAAWGQNAGPALGRFDAIGRRAGGEGDALMGDSRISSF